MPYRTSLAAALVATTFLGGAALAAEQSAKPTAAQETSARKAVERDVGKLSKDGAQAFRDMHLARVAIFDADPAKAQDFVGKAQAALAKARTDDAVFNRAEADLKTPADVSAAKTAADTSAKAGKPAGEQVAWVPVDAQLTLGEDFVATPEKAGAVAEANKHLAKGDRKGALEKLRLADVDVDFVMAVLPLDKTVADVNQAATLLGQGKYYEANALLKTAEDRTRFDVIDAVGVPRKAAAHAADKAGADAKTTDAKTTDTKTTDTKSTDTTTAK